MDSNRIDRLLDEHFAQPVRHQPLPQLQRAVWQGIAARRRPSPLITWLEDFFAGEMRLGPVFAAMVMGIALGYATLGAPMVTSAYAASEELGFTVFSSSYSHPLQKVKL